MPYRSETHLFTTLVGIKINRGKGRARKAALKDMSVKERTIFDKEELVLQLVKFPQYETTTEAASDYHNSVFN